MLRVGLTGGLGSGKTTVAGILRELGLHVLEADSIARAMMQPGEPVFRAIADHFGASVLAPDGSLDRARLARLAFSEGRLKELNQIVHPPVIAEQERRMKEIFSADSEAIVVVESAVIFEAEASGTAMGWRERFDRIILVTAPEPLRIQRFVTRTLRANSTPEERAAAERDARSRLAWQLSDEVKIPQSDFVIDNSGALEDTRAQCERVAAELRNRHGV